MSSRGGGGRGRGSRGRGRGALPPSIQHQLGLSGSHYSTASTASAAGASQAAMLNIIQSSIGEKLTPGPLFPDVALPVPSTECSAEQKALLLIQRTLGRMIEQSAYCLQAKAPPSDIQRYSDKYLQQRTSKAVKIHDIKTDIATIPDDLLAVYRPEKAKASKQPSAGGLSGLLMMDLLRLEEMEKKEGAKPEAAKQDEDEDPALDEDEYEEDEFEEETDYNLNYFDPGEDYGDYDEGGGGDEPYY